MVWYTPAMDIHAGQKFGRWTVLAVSPERKVRCRCDCGTERDVDRYNLLRPGHSRSCGCLKGELTTSRNHGRRKGDIQAGDRFARWTVLDTTDWLAMRCRCDCGTERNVPAGNLRNGLSKSCGCLKSELAKSRPSPNRKHGHGGTRVYACWKGVMRRCLNTHADDYPRYGGRGIKLHEPWRDPAVFIREVEAEIGPMPDGLTLDRINNDGNYEPGNLRWTTRLVQAQNRHNTWDSRLDPPQPGELVALRRNRRKLTHEQMVKMLHLIEKGATQTDVAHYFGISQPHVSRLVREARKTE